MKRVLAFIGLVLLIVVGVVTVTSLLIWNPVYFVVGVFGTMGFVIVLGSLIALWDWLGQFFPDNRYRGRS